MSHQKHQSKICKSCGREFSWRKKYEDIWNDVKYCSQSCRSRKLSSIDIQIETLITEMLATQSTSICPSLVAREVFNANWRDHMERVRRAGRRLANRGEIYITQQGEPVDPSLFKGPIRFSRRNKSKVLSESQRS